MVCYLTTTCTPAKANIGASIFDLDMVEDGYAALATIQCVTFDFDCDLDPFVPSTGKGGEVDEDDEQEVWYEALEKVEVTGLE